MIFTVMFCFTAIRMFSRVPSRSAERPMRERAEMDMGDKRQRLKPKRKQNRAEDIQMAPVAATPGKSQLEGRSFLYVGGRDCQVAHLRQIATSHGAELIHHDGGLREAVSRIDHILPS